MSIKYYKVLSVFNRALYSAVLNRYAIKYKLKGWTSPVIKNSKLFVFNDLHLAKEWAIDNQRIVVEVEIDAETVVNTVVRVTFSSVPKNVLYENYWDNKIIDNEHTMAIPKGTVGCGKLRLIRPVYLDKELEHSILGNDVAKFLGLTT